MTDTATQSTIEVGDKVRVNGEHTFLGRTYTTEAKDGSVGVVEEDHGTYVWVKWESHPEDWTRTQPGLTSNVNKSCLVKVQAEPTERELLDMLKARYIEFGMNQGGYESYYTDEALRSTLERRVATPAAAWVSERQPLVYPGDKVMLKNSLGEDLREAVVVWTEPDTYTSDSLAIYTYSKERESCRWNDYAYTVVEKWNPKWGDERGVTEENVPDWVTDKAPHVKIGDTVKVLSEGSANGDYEYVDTDWVGRTCKVVATLSEPSAPYSSTGERLPIAVTSDSRSGYQYVGHYEKVEEEAVRNPQVEVGDTVTVLEFLVGSAPAVNQDYKVATVDNGSGRPIVYDSRGETWTATGWTLAKKKEATPEPGSKVTVTASVLNTTRLRDFLQSQEYLIYVGPSGYGRRPHRVSLPEHVFWPNDILMAGRMVDVEEVKHYDEGDPSEWASLIQRVLDEVHEEACDNDWCEEYEQTMEARFNITPEDRGNREQEYEVEVTLESRIDPDNYIEAESVFGYGVDGQISSSGYVEARADVTLILTTRGEPDTDDVKDALDSAGYNYDDFSINSTTAV